jgi:hypothetical protein
MKQEASVKATELVFDMFPRNARMYFNGLHGVISQKTGLFITTALTISNPVTLIHSPLLIGL